MRKIFLTILIINFVSCFERNNQGIDVGEIDDTIYLGMSKHELMNRLGKPKDSIQSFKTNYNSHIYIYETNDFTGYTLKVWFNEENKITNFRVD